MMNVIGEHPTFMDNGATITPFDIAPPFLPVRRHSESPNTAPRSTPSRSSTISSRLPYLRRLEIGADMAPRHQKVPLLTLKLSSTSFLDSCLYDDHLDDPLYVIRTIGALTTIRRSDPWEGPIPAADIRWPTTFPIKGKSKDLEGVCVQLAGGRWKDAKDLLKLASLLQTHKFNIPSFSHCLKWKRSGASYHCTCSTVKGPIATFETASASSPAQLIMFETFRDKHEEQKMSTHSGVSTHLLDYILTTLLLVVTDVQEWTTINSTDALSSQWRYGELRGSKTRLPPTTVSADSPPDSPAKTPTSSAVQWPNIAYGEPLCPSLRSPSPSISETASRTSYSTWDTPRPSTDSPLFSSTASLAFSQTFVDPRPRYHDPDVPPVPEIPLQYRSPSSTSGVSTGHSASNSPMGQERSATPSLSLERHLLDQSWRSKSTTPETPDSVPVSLPASPNWLPSHVSIPGRASSILSTTKSRRLPRPPQSAAAVSALLEKRASQVSVRVLPPTPLSGPSSSVSEVDAQQAKRHEQLEKEAKELASWVHTLTSEHHIPSVREAVFDVPPPAYNDINFSHSDPH